MSAILNLVLDMKILGISGSPRKDGNSDVAAKTILEMLGNLSETEFIRIGDYTIKHCRGCGACWKLKHCIIEDDDFQELLNKMKAADLLIISDPVYWLNPPGLMKDVIDRTVSIHDQPSPFKDQQVVLLTIAAENGFELHNELLSRWLRRFDAKIIGNIDLYASGKDDLVKNHTQMTKLKDFAAEIMRTVR